jgi:Rod binding domain-containing protein
MGFAELLGKTMSKLFAPQTQAATQQWAENLTLEQIEEYERQGLDMSEYRLMREKRPPQNKSSYRTVLTLLI